MNASDSLTPGSMLEGVLRLPRALRRNWIEVGLTSVMINVGQLLLPLFSMLVYDKIVSNGVFETLWALALGMVIFIAMDAGMRTVRTWAVENVASDISRKLDRALWQRLLEDRDGPSGGVPAFLAHYRELTGAFNFVSATYLLALADLPFYLLYMLVIGVIAWPMAILIAVLTLTYAGIGYVLQARMQRLARQADQASTARMTMIGQVMQGLDVLRTVPGVHRIEAAWSAGADRASATEGAKRLAASHGNTLAAGMATSTVVAVLVTGAYLIEAGMLTVGGLIACSLLASRAMMTVASLYLVLGKWKDFTEAVARMEALFHGKARDSAASTSTDETIRKPHARGDIVVRQVFKQYPGRAACLENISLNISPGEKVALLGRPGAGKSTLLKAIAGLAAPDSGNLLIDGYAVASIHPDDRAQWLAYKPQEPVLFAGTLEENLLIAGCRVDDPLFERALWASGLEDELKRGRMALSMTIADCGSNLSGGQRQKVALARAFAQSPRVLLLDEPSLGLDPEGEKLLAERLPAVIEQGSLIMVSHSAAMLQVVERVIGLDEGRIVADGPREKLVRAG